jgi:exopolysaccharide biosynthesis predicted pyruvyltransferase EpsI
MSRLGSQVIQMANENINTINKQQVFLDQLYASHAKFGQSYALLEFPNYSNVGDSAIWLGAIACLKRLTGRMPSYVATHTTLDFIQLNKDCPDGPIFINGGGNFGDIYSFHQDSRERIIKSLLDRRLIQLPQSIKFYDKEATKRCAALIAKHPSFFLYVRDVQSEAFALENFSCPVKLAPDSAFGIGALQPSVKPIHRLLALMRGDDERAGFDIERIRAVPGALVADWLDESAPDEKLRMDYAKLKGRAARLLLGYSKRVGVFNNWALARLQRGVRLLSSAEVLICDRLHAHILAVLLNLPHVYLDNNYGKIAGYASQWTNDYPMAVKADSLEDAIIKAEQLRTGRIATDST